MTARCLTAVLIAVSLLPQIAHAGGPAPSSGTRLPFSIQTRGHGLVVTLITTSPDYPQNALVRATVRLWNSTSAPMQVQEPTVDVLWPSGATAFSAQQGRYPAGVVAVSPPFKEPTGGPPPAPTIGPRQAIARHVFVIMRTGRLQAVVLGGGSPVASFVLRTPVLLARLGRALSPRITFAKQGGTVVATIAPASKLQLGGLWYMSALRCGSTTSGTVTWTHAPSADQQPDGFYRLPAPGCQNPTEWHLVAGWLDQPLGAGNYSAQVG